MLLNSFTSFLNIKNLILPHPNPLPSGGGLKGDRGEKKYEGSRAVGGVDLHIIDGEIGGED